MKVHDIARFLHTSDTNLYLGLGLASVAATAYVSRRLIAKGVARWLHKRKHGDFCDSFIPMKKIGGKPIYPKFKWKSINLPGGKRVIRKAYLEATELFVDGVRSLQLERWSTEFGVLFTHATMPTPGRYLLWRSMFEAFPVVTDRDLDHVRSTKEKFVIGMSERGKPFKIAVFTGVDGITKIVAMTGHGKTFLLGRIAKCAQEQHPNVHILLCTSKDAHVVQRECARPIEIMNPVHQLEAVRDRLLQLRADAEERLLNMDTSRGDVDLSRPVLLIVDEAGSMLTTSKTAKPEGEIALKQEITEILGDCASRMRSAGMHLIVSGQLAGSSDLPEKLKANVSNTIVGKINQHYYESHFQGVRSSFFEGLLPAGDWYIETRQDVIEKVRVVRSQHAAVTSEEEK